MKKWLSVLGAGIISAIALPVVIAWIIGIVGFIKGVIYFGEIRAWDVCSCLFLMLLAGGIGAFIYSIDEE